MAAKRKSIHLPDSSTLKDDEDLIAERKKKTTVSREVAPPSLSPTVCEPCAKKHRQCDKALPSCEECIKKGSNCHYPQRKQSSDLASSTVRSETADAESRSTSASMVHSPALTMVNSLPTEHENQVHDLLSELLESRLVASKLQIVEGKLVVNLVISREVSLDNVQSMEAQSLSRSRDDPEICTTDFHDDTESINQSTLQSGTVDLSTFTTEEQALISLYLKYSSRELHRLRPEVWNTHGKWRPAYKNIANEITKPAKGKKGGPSGIMTNRKNLSYVMVNGVHLQVGIVHQDESYDRVLVAFTRASSISPTYGMEGMWQRAATAAQAWAVLEPEKRNFIMALPRSQVASKWALKEERSLSREMINLLNALPDGMLVELLSVGVDGLTTDVDSLKWLYSEWRRLKIWVVFVVPEHFPGSQKGFPRATNGIRYGRYKLEDIAASVEAESYDGRCKELLKIIERIRWAKEDRDQGGHALSDWTFGRANFRVCPISRYDSGVNEDEQRRSRGLNSGDSSAILDGLSSIS